MEMKVCGQCNKIADLKCAACGLIYYCGKEHQKTHWTQHKQQCVAYRVESNSTLGRFLVANRFIRAGSVILKKSPLIAGPKMVTLPVCLGCHRSLSSDCMPCSKCKWHLCRPECEQSHWHQAECAFLAAGKLRQDSVDFQRKSAHYSVILPLRALLLKTTHPKRFDELLALQSHFENNKTKPIYAYLAKTLLPLLRNLKVPGAEEINPLQICSIFDTNAFEVRNEHVNIRAVYPLISFIAHSCRANTRHVCDDDYAMSVLAIRDIHAGELISTTYTQVLWPTMYRRAHLKGAKHFDCTCERCCDPTELQTFVGSLKCQNCGEGLLLSTDPLNAAASWVCTQCQNPVGAHQVETMNEQIRSEILDAERSVPSFEHLLRNYSHLLHANSSHMLEMKYALLQLYEKSGTLAAAQSIRIVELCQDLLAVSHILEPGCSSFNETLDNAKRNAELRLKALEHAT